MWHYLLLYGADIMHVFIALGRYGCGVAHMMLVSVGPSVPAGCYVRLCPSV